jgi:hypothetical protein
MTIPGAVGHLGGSSAGEEITVTRTTVVYAPHPDDETLYLSGYITTVAARGHRLVLVAVEDGGSSAVRPPGWTQKDVENVRVMEQTAAWAALTRGRTEIHRLRISDAATATASVRAMAQVLERSYAGGVEHYVAGNSSTSQSSLHQAVANGVRGAGVAVARFSLLPGQSGGWAYFPPPDRVPDCELAWEIYRAFGHLSVDPLFTLLRDSGFRTRITA